MAESAIPGVRYCTPVRVFRLMKTEWALKAIRHGRVRVSRLTDLNDPFECVPLDLSNQFVRDAQQRTKVGWNRLFGVVCFSKSWRSPVLWAHYADAHKGLCLGFVVPDYRLKDVRYIDERMSLHDLVIGDVDALWLTKYGHWRYEEEVRIVAPLGTPEADGQHYLPMDESLRLTDVILGCRCTASVVDIQAAVSVHPHPVRISRCVPAVDSFAMVEDEALEV